jgi:CHAT domain-containing protein
MIRLLALAFLLLPSARAAVSTEALKLAEDPILPRDHRGAVAVIEPALREAQRLGDTRAARKLSNKLGGIYWLPLNDWPKAYEMYQVTRAADRKLGDRKAEAQTLYTLATMTSQFGDVAKAAQLYEEAAALAHEAGDETARADYLKHSAFFRRMQDQFDGVDAAGPAPPAPKFDPKALPAEQSAAAWGLLERGDVKAARAIYERLGDDAGLAYCMLAEKDWRGAETRFAAHNARYEAMPPGVGWRPPDYMGQARALEGLGRRDEAVRLYRKAWEQAEKKHERFKLDRNDSYYTFISGIGDEIVSVAGDENEAFYYAEAGRARILAKALGTRRAAGLQPLSGALARREADIAGRVAGLQRRRDAADQPGSWDERDRLDRELRQGPGRELEEFLPELRRARPDYAAAHYPRPLRAADIPLSGDEVLVEYAVTESLTKIFVVRGGRVAATHTVPMSYHELTRLVRQYRASFDDVERAEDLARFDVPAGSRLADLLWKPVLGDIPKGAKVIVAPDKSLWLLPFEALVLDAPARPLMPSGAHGPAPTGLRYVGDDYDIAYAPSATALATQRLLKRGTRASEELFVLADPVFGPSDPRWRGTGAPSAFRAEVRGAVLKSMGLGGKRSGRADGKTTAAEAGFPRLDKTALLAEALQKKIFAGQGSLVLQGESATEARVKAADLSRYRYLVFATHGILDGSVPYLREPALVLGQEGGTEDGFLTMGEVEKLKLNADLVALTACQTGIGRAIRGEGTLGLVRAFQLAGADSVLVSLWSVAEDSTSELARVFFAGLHDGLPPRTALRRARAEVRRQGYEHPFYWAPFILVGD